MVNFSAILETIREIKQFPNLNRIIEQNRYTLAINRAYGKNMAIYNAPGSDRNPDKDYAKVGLDESTKIQWGEAIAVDGSDTVMIYGWVDSCSGIKKYGDDKWTFEPQLCAVELRKTTLEGVSKASGKPYKIEAYPMALAFIYQLTEGENAVGFGRPFKGLLDVSSGADIALWAMGKPNASDEVPEPGELDFIKKRMLVITPLEKLEKMEGKAIPEGKQGRGGYGGGGGQKMLAQLDDKMIFIQKVSNAENEPLEQVLKSRFPGAEDDTRQMLVASWLEKLVN